MTVHGVAKTQTQLSDFTFTFLYILLIVSLVAQTVKHLPAMWETWLRSLGREDPLQKKMAMHSSALAWKIPWAEEPGKLQSMGSQIVRHKWATSLSFPFSVYSCHLFLVSSIRSLQFLSFIMPFFAWNVPLISVTLLKWSLIFPSLLFFSTSLHCSLKKAFLCPFYSLELCIQLDISFPSSFAFPLSSFLSHL